MKLKMITVDGKQYAETKDGKPVYVYDDGTEVSYDAPATVEKIKALNAEAKGHREAKEAAEAALKKFEGIEDPEAARTAIETVQNLDQGKLVAAGKVEEIKAAAKKAAEEQVAEVRKSLEEKITSLTTDNQSLRSGWDRDKIGSRFASSKYIAEKLATPGPVVQKIFGENFKIEDGREVAYDANGKKLYSRANPGEPADFDDALAQLVDAYPFRESLVRGSGGGSGGRGSGGGNGIGAKQISRAEFERMDHGARAERMKEGYTVVDQGTAA